MEAYNGDVFKVSYTNKMYAFLDGDWYLYYDIFHCVGVTDINILKLAKCGVTINVDSDDVTYIKNVIADIRERKINKILDGSL